MKVKIATNASAFRTGPAVFIKRLDEGSSRYHAKYGGLMKTKLPPGPGDLVSGFGRIKTTIEMRDRDLVLAGGTHSILDFLNNEGRHLTFKTLNRMSLMVGIYQQNPLVGKKVTLVYVFGTDPTYSRLPGFDCHDIGSEVDYSSGTFKSPALIKPLASIFQLGYGLSH